VAGNRGGSALEDGEKALIDIENNQVAGGGVDGMNLAHPRSIALLFADDAREELAAEGEPFFVALSIDDLAVVQVCVVPMSEGLIFSHDIVQGFAAVGKHFGDMLTVVIAGVVECGQGSGGDGGPRRSHLFAAVADTTIAGIFAIVDIFLCAFNDLCSDRNTGVAAPAESLDLGDGGRAFIVVIAIFSADIAPASRGRLSFTAEVDCFLEDADDFFAAIFEALFAQKLREEQHREAMAIGIANVGVGITDQAIVARFGDQKIGCPRDVHRVGSLAGSGAGGEECCTGEGGESDAVGGSVPLAARILSAGQILQAVAGRLIPGGIARWFFSVESQYSRTLSESDTGGSHSREPMTPRKSQLLYRFHAFLFTLLLVPKLLLMLTLTGCVHRLGQ